MMRRRRCCLLEENIAATGLRAPRSGGCRRAAAMSVASGGSALQRARKPGDKLDEIDLASGAGLHIKLAEMTFNGLRRNPECLGDLGAAADLDDGEQAIASGSEGVS